MFYPGLTRLPTCSTSPPLPRSNLPGPPLIPIRISPSLPPIHVPSPPNHTDQPNYFYYQPTTNQPVTSLPTSRTPSAQDSTPNMCLLKTYETRGPGVADPPPRRGNYTSHPPAGVMRLPREWQRSPSPRRRSEREVRYIESGHRYDLCFLLLLLFWSCIFVGLVCFWWGIDAASAR